MTGVVKVERPQEMEEEKLSESRYLKSLLVSDERWKRSLDEILHIARSKAMKYYGWNKGNIEILKCTPHPDLKVYAVIVSTNLKNVKGPLDRERSEKEKLYEERNV